MTSLFFTDPAISLEFLLDTHGFEGPQRAVRAQGYFDRIIVVAEGVKQRDKPEAAHYYDEFLKVVRDSQEFFHDTRNTLAAVCAGKTISESERAYITEIPGKLQHYRQARDAFLEAGQRGEIAISDPYQYLCHELRLPDGSIIPAVPPWGQKMYLSMHLEEGTDAISDCMQKLQDSLTHEQSQYRLPDSFFAAAQAGVPADFAAAEDTAAETVERQAEQSEKGLADWMNRLKNEKWMGKKGLAFAGATIGLGAILYGGYKLLQPHDKEQQR